MHILSMKDFIMFCQIRQYTGIAKSPHSLCSGQVMLRLVLLDAKRQKESNFLLRTSNDF